MKADLDFVDDYVQRQAEVLYGCDFEELNLDIQEQLYSEAQADFEATKISEAEAISDRLKEEKMIDTYLHEGYDRLKDEEFTNDE